MFKVATRAGGLAAFILAAQASPAQAILGPDAAACRGSGPAILVNVNGFKARSGNVRVNVYNSADRFLARGQYIRQINVPVTRAGAMPICVSVPRAGQYAVAVRHDVSGNGNDWGDGGGFSRNPRLSLINLRPRFQNVAFGVGQGVANINVVLNYRFGLSVHPVQG